jgi:large subunit ribosomal protein L19
MDKTALIKKMANLVQAFNQRQIDKLREGKDPYPEFGPGDTLSVHVKIREGERERVQRFEGLCLSRRNAGVASSFRVRRISGGVGIERVFPLYSPLIHNIECLRRGKVRRNKIYYVRKLSRKLGRIKERVA